MTRPDYYRRLLADRTKTEALLTDAIALHEYLDQHPEAIP